MTNGVNVLREDNPDNLDQLIRLPGQQEDKETGLYYNRHRYYNPGQGSISPRTRLGWRGDGIYIATYLIIR